MSRPGDFDNMIGTDFALAQSLLSPPGALRLDDVLSECYQTFGADERDSECGPPFAVLKFACHSTTNPTQHGFIRMYIQIPYDRTLRSSREIRELQAEDNPVHKEYEALTTLSKSKCSKCMATPELLGYGQGRQGPEAYVPNGYITYVAWQRVPGSPLDSRFFWLEENRQYRDEVRAAFAVAYKELNKYGWQPAIRGPRKLIYDSFSKTMHISGFRPAMKFKERSLSALTYSAWGLVKHPQKSGWHLNTSGWTW